LRIAKPAQSPLVEHVEGHPPLELPLLPELPLLLPPPGAVQSPGAQDPPLHGSPAQQYPDGQLMHIPVAEQYPQSTVPPLSQSDE
jgi:hypothetical protein